MAEVTPRKRACCSVELLCRCCGVKTETNRRIYLFGKDDGILEAIKEFAGREISEDDEFSKYVCRSCTTKILTIKKKVNQFRNFSSIQKTCREIYQNQNASKEDENWKFVSTI